MYHLRVTSHFLMPISANAESTSQNYRCRPLLELMHHYMAVNFKATLRTRLLSSDWTRVLLLEADWIVGKQRGDIGGSQP